MLYNLDMHLNIPYSIYSKEIIQNYKKINLRISDEKLTKKSISEIIDLINKKHIHSIYFNFFIKNFNFLNDLSNITTVNIILNMQNISDFINMHYRLNNSKINLIVIGLWDKETVRIIKKVAMIGFSVTVIFERIDTINQNLYMDLFNFIFLNNYIDVKIEPFKALFFSFLNNNKIDFYNIYNEYPGENFYVDDDKNVSFNSICLKNDKIFGKLDDGLDKWKNSNEFNKLIKINQVKNNKECRTCIFLENCRGFIKNNYNYCSDWVEILHGLKEFATLIKNYNTDNKYDFT